MHKTSSGVIKGPPPQYPNNLEIQYALLFSAKDEKAVTQTKAELFIYFKDKADKQTPVSLGGKKQFQKFQKEPIATLQQ